MNGIQPPRGAGPAAMQRWYSELSNVIDGLNKKIKSLEARIAELEP